MNKKVIIMAVKYKGNVNKGMNISKAISYILIKAKAM